MSRKLIKLIPDALPSVDELPGDLALVAEVIGVPMTMKLVQVFRGRYIYFRNLDHLIREKRNQAMRDECDKRCLNGDAITRIVKDLATEHGLVERTVWDILGRPPEEPCQTMTSSPQLYLFS